MNYKEYFLWTLVLAVLVLSSICQVLALDAVRCMPILTYRVCVKFLSEFKIYLLGDTQRLPWDKYKKVNYNFSPLQGETTSKEVGNWLVIDRPLQRLEISSSNITSLKIYLSRKWIIGLIIFCFRPRLLLQYHKSFIISILLNPLK